MLERFRTRRSGEGGEIQQVIENLNNVLNTRRGFGSDLRELGIGDYNAHVARDKVVQAIIADIKENIALFEPRVRLEDIHEVGAESGLRLKFELHCVFLNHAHPLYIVVDSLYNRVFVEG